MKIVLTRKQALDLFTKALGAQVNEFQISDGIYELALTVSPLVTPKIKIDAIKKLREVLKDFAPDGNCIGLADAKYAVENWSSFLTFLKEHNRFPKVQVDYSDKFSSGTVIFS